jgi:hypothetical protein
MKQSIIDLRISTAEAIAQEFKFISYGKELYILKDGRLYRDAERVVRSRAITLMGNGRSAPNASAVVTLVREGAESMSDAHELLRDEQTRERAMK